MKTTAVIIWMASLATATEPILIKVYNAAGLNPKVFNSAVKEADMLLKFAGQSAEWINCGTGSSTGSDACAETSRLTFSLGIRNDDPRGNVTNFALGFAMLGSENANSACVILSKVKALVGLKTTTVSVETVLAYVMVHELFHMINRNNHHSDGLMGVEWTTKEVREMAQRRLRFSTSQIQDLERAIRSRQNTQTASTL